MRRTIFLFTVLIFLFHSAYSQSSSKLSREDYIGMYKDMAIREMLRSGVPASITLAQGMLESDNGNSTLAVKANNHFGIKCHSSWNGKKIYHDDDAKNECFRKYKSVEESYIDHSDFLMNGSRYSFLFELHETDYKAWAKGLKKAGYATSNKYADLLIKIIEENELHQYDLAEGDIKPERERRSRRQGKTGRNILSNNRIDYVVVEAGDNIESLTDKLDLLKNEIYRYNELSSDSVLYPGQIIYIQPKRNKAAAGKTIHILKEGESLYSVSQKYGIKLDKLQYRNGIKPGDNIEPGTEILLRKGKRPGLKIELEENPEETEELEFEFDG